MAPTPAADTGAVGDASAPGGPLVVLVTGRPGSGKSTLGTELARLLRVPFIARDDVRGGLFFTEGAWTDRPRRVPGAEQSAEAFLRAIETLAGLGVSCVAEYVVRRGRPSDLDRITAVARCVVLVATAGDARARVVRRNRADRLLNRRPVLDLLGFSSIEEHTADAVSRMELARREMQTEFDLPTLQVSTDGDVDPDLDAIVEFITRGA